MLGRPAVGRSSVAAPAAIQVAIRGKETVDKTAPNFLRVALVWNETIIQERVLTKAARIVVGEDMKSCDFVMPSAGLPANFDLLRPSGDGYTFRFTGAIEGKISVGDEEMSIEDLLKDGAKGVRTDGEAREIDVSSGDWGVLQLGNLGLFFQFVSRIAAVPAAPLMKRVDWGFAATLLLALLLHLSFLLAARLLFEGNMHLSEFGMPDRFIKYIVEKPDEIPEPEKEDFGKKEDVGKKAGGKEGKFGKKDAKVKQSKVPKRDGELVKKIQDLGIHKALGSNLLGTGPLKDIFGDRTGFDTQMAVAMSGHGDQLVIGQGSGGMGLRGTGSGGGGSGFGRVWGMGKIDTGGGRGVRANLGGKSRRKVKASVSRGKPQATGFCSTADIQRVVGARAAGIKFCYEKELQRNPSLAGKIIVNWLIKTDGRVGKAHVVSSSMKSSKVENCILKQIRRWRFKKPEGGMCSVNFPFVFKGGL
jgi:hypothetical protein